MPATVDVGPVELVAHLREGARLEVGPRSAFLFLSVLGHCVRVPVRSARIALGLLSVRERPRPKAPEGYVLYEWDRA
jgi:hypothetical protein